MTRVTLNCLLKQLIRKWFLAWMGVVASAAAGRGSGANDPVFSPQKNRAMN